MREALRRNKIQFLHQHIFAPYITDFYLFDRNVAVEVDGRHHLSKDEGVRERTLLHNYKVSQVLRFQNTEVTTQLPRIIEELRALPIVYRGPVPVG
jgi:very-short-patch-repair endonuclease